MHNPQEDCVVVDLSDYVEDDNDEHVDVTVTKIDNDHDKTVQVVDPKPTREIVLPKIETLVEHKIGGDPVDALQAFISDEEDGIGENLKISFVDDDELADTQLYVPKSASERGILDDEQIFNDLLTVFRRDPSLVTRKVRLQTLQELVVSPDDVKRLIKQVQRVILAKNEFDVEYCPERPVVDSILDPRHTEFKVRWLRPIVYDQMTIYSPQVTKEELSNQQTVRYGNHNTAIAVDYETFGFPGPARARRQPYQTSKIHEFVRKSYHSLLKDPLDPDRIVTLQTPVKSFVTGANNTKTPGTPRNVATQYDQSCVNAIASPLEYNYASGTEIFRVSNNIDLTSVLTDVKPLTFENRVASYPVIEFNLDPETRHDLTIRQMYPGDDMLIVGFATANHFDQDARSGIETYEVLSTKDVPNSLSTINTTSEKSQWTGHILSKTSLKDALQYIVPDQLGVLKRHEDELDACFNFRHVHDILKLYALNLDMLTAASVAAIRNRLTRNIMHLEDDKITNEEEMLKTLADSTSDPDAYRTDDTSFFLEEQNDRDHVLAEYEELSSKFTGRNDIDVRVLAMSDDEGDLYCLLRGIRWLTERSINEIQEDIDAAKQELARLRQLEQKLPTRLLGTELTSLISNPSVFLQKHQTISNFYKTEESFVQVTNLQKCLRDWQSIDEKLIERARQVKLFRNRLKNSAESSASSLPLSTPVKTFSDYTPKFIGSTDGGINLPNVIESEGKLYEVSIWGSQFNLDETHEYASPEAQRSFAGQSIYPAPKSLFSTKPLQSIANAFVVMMNPEKLSFVMTDDDLKKVVFDVSEVFDELEDERIFRHRYVYDRRTPGMSSEDIAALRTEASEAFATNIGPDRDVKTNRKVAIILARLLVELETHRPKYAFKKIFPLSGRKTIGRDEDIKYESFTEDTKLTYLITVASRGAGLGAQGVLMSNSQADNLKNIGTYAAEAYDKFIQMDRIKSLYKAAAIVDEKQVILESQRNKQEIETGFQYVMRNNSNPDNPHTKSLLARYYEYDVSRQDLQTDLIKLDKDINNLLSLRQFVLNKARYVSYKWMESVQEQLNSEPPDDIDAYNPDQYGEEKGSAACHPDSVCIFNTNLDFRQIRPDLIKEGEWLRLFMIKTRMPRHCMSLHRRSSYKSVDVAVCALLVPRTDELAACLQKSSLFETDSAKSAIHDAYSEYIRRFRMSSFKVEVNEISPYETPIRLDILKHVTVLMQGIGAERQISNILSSGLGRLHQSYQYIVNLIKNHPEYVRRYQWKWLEPSVQANVSLMRNYNIQFRKHISLLRNSLRVPMNDYTLIETKTETSSARYIDQDKYTKTISHRKVVGEKVALSDISRLNQKQESYLTKYETLGEILKNYAFVNTLAEIETVAVSSKTTDSDAAETLLSLLVKEMTGVMDYVKKNDFDSAMVQSTAAFLSEFIQWCDSTQQVLDLSQEVVDLDLARRREMELIKTNSLSQSQKSELFTLREHGIVQVYEDDIYNTDDLDNDPGLTMHSVTNKMEYDMIDEENAMNFYQGEVEDND